MNARLRAIASTLVAVGASALLAGSAQAVMIAGWDFSQYQASGALDAGQDFQTDQTLDANFSHLDSTSGAGMTGPEGGSDVFGIMLADGSAGSDTVSTGFAANELEANSNDLLSNRNVGVPTSPQMGDSCTTLKGEGQLNCNALSLTATEAFSVVFKADVSSLGLVASGWSVSFGGRTLSGSQNLVIDFSSNDDDFDDTGELGVAMAALGAADSPFSFNLPGADGAMGFVRFNFLAPADATGLNQGIIDNVAISAVQLVPEPGTALLLLSGLLGLTRAGRRRQA